MTTTNHGILLSSIKINNMSSTYTSAELLGLAEKVFLHYGFSESDASLSAHVLLEADLRGIDSHGVARLQGYVRLIEKGRINPRPKIKIVRERASIATIDGDGGIGLVVGPKAMSMAIEKALQTGTGSVAVNNSNHFGIAAWHSLMATEQGCIGLSMTNASPLVTTANTAERLLGTNPICVAFPAGEHPPLVFDLATSAAANGKLEIAEREGKPIPPGWILSPDGSYSTDPTALKKGGALLPLGSFPELGVHKGYGLGAMVDLFSGVLGGAAYGPWVPPFVAFLDPVAGAYGQGIGHFFTAWEVEAFRSIESYESAIHHWIQRMKSAKPLDPQVPIMVHGEPEIKHKVERIAKGIPLQDSVVKSLEELAQNCGIPWK